jgi:hypothetical protein
MFPWQAQSTKTEHTNEKGLQKLDIELDSGHVYTILFKQSLLKYKEWENGLYL